VRIKFSSSLDEVGRGRVTLAAIACGTVLYLILLALGIV
jgi:hypothetical protein